jgi:hypothetical protein
MCISLNYETRWIQLNPVKGIYPCYAASTKNQIDIKKKFQVSDGLKTLCANHSPDSYGSGI